MKYLVIIEKTATGFSAYSPDVEGCIATATTIAELKQSMQAAMEFHLEGLKQAGYLVPEPKSFSEYIDVAA